MAAVLVLIVELVTKEVEEGSMEATAVGGGEGKMAPLERCKGRVGPGPVPTGLPTPGKLFTTTAWAADAAVDAEEVVDGVENDTEDAVANAAADAAALAA